MPINASVLSNECHARECAVLHHGNDLLQPRCGVTAHRGRRGDPHHLGNRGLPLVPYQEPLDCLILTGREDVLDLRVDVLQIPKTNLLTTWADNEIHPLLLIQSTEGMEVPKHISQESNREHLSAQCDPSLA